MAYCVAPSCSHPHNADDARYCQSCGAVVLLKERYLPTRPLQAGGFGKTFLARDTHLPSQPICVVKQLLGFEGEAIAAKATQLFRQEAIRLEELGDHPQIPKLYAHFEQGGRLYLVQEYVEGPTLTEALRAEGALDEGAARVFLREVATVLDFIHRRYIIHRDIKPTNILRRASDGQYVLIDFGIAKVFSEQNLAQTGTVIGSPEYMPMEQMRGRVVPASDLFSLGMTCVYGMILRSPLDVHDVGEDCWRWRENLPGDRTVSDRFARVIDRLLVTPLSKRYGSAADLLADLQALEQPVQSSQVGVRWADRSRRRLPVGGEGVVDKIVDKVLEPRSVTEDDFTSYLTEVNYDQLRNFLQARQWEKADAETWACLSEALKQPREKFVAYGDLRRVPCGDLAMVDVLWRKYSQGRFGLSKQVEIFEAGGWDYGRFCQVVGWTTHATATPQMQYHSNAPDGHLPSRRWIGGSSWWKHLQVMAEKLASCQIG